MIGEMRQIKMEKWTTTKDINKNNVEAITKNISTWARVTRTGGDVSSINGNSGLTNFFVFKIHYQNFDPTGNWRIIFDRRKFAVRSIEKENQNEFFWIIKAEAFDKR